MIDYCDIKCQIIDYIIKNYAQPIDYNFKADLESLLTELRNQKITFDEIAIKNNLQDQRIREFWQNYKSKDNYINYNQFHSKTG